MTHSFFTRDGGRSNRAENYETNPRTPILVCPRRRMTHSFFARDGCPSTRAENYETNPRPPILGVPHAPKAELIGLRNPRNYSNAQQGKLGTGAVNLVYIVHVRSAFRAPLCQFASPACSAKTKPVTLSSPYREHRLAGNPAPGIGRSASCDRYPGNAAASRSCHAHARGYP
jgi:hypothetical protein